MPKKYKKNYKLGKSGKKALIVAGCLLVVGAVVSTALYYSFKSDQRVKLPSSSLPLLPASEPAAPTSKSKQQIANYSSGAFVAGGSKDLYVDVGSAPTEAQIVAEVQASDYSGCTVEVVSSDYESGKVGDYIISLKATDAAGNIATLDLLVHVASYQPTLRAKTGSSTEVTVGYSRLKDWSMITDLYVGADFNGAPLDVYVSNTDGLKFSRVGIYHPVLAVSDSAGRVATLTITVTVTDDLPPVFLLSDMLCVVSKDKPLTVPQLESTILLANNAQQDKVRSLSFYEDTYTDNARTSGRYQIGYELSLIDASTRSGTMSVIVLDDDINTSARTPWTSFWDTITSGWVDFWTKLGNLLRFRGWTL